MNRVKQKGFTIVSVLIGVAFIVHAIRSWRVQSATLQMQKDIGTASKSGYTGCTEATS